MRQDDHLKNISPQRRRGRRENQNLFTAKTQRTLRKFLCKKPDGACGVAIHSEVKCGFTKLLFTLRPLRLCGLFTVFSAPSASLR
jgi:hypothetical protein